MSKQNTLLDFYNYQIRKDFIDKFNICDVKELNLSIQLRVHQKVQLPKLRDFTYLTKTRVIFESFTGQSSAVRFVKVYDKVKNKSRMISRFFYCNLYCTLNRLELIFNLLTILYCMVRFSRKSNFKFFGLTGQDKQTKFIYFCNLRKLYLRHFFWIPKLKRSRQYLSLFFYMKKNSAFYVNQVSMFKKLLKRLKILRRSFKEETKSPQLV